MPFLPPQNKYPQQCKPTRGPGNLTHSRKQEAKGRGQPSGPHSPGSPSTGKATEARSPKDTGFGQPGSCSTVRPGRGRLSTWRVEEAGKRAVSLWCTLLPCPSTHSKVTELTPMADRSVEHRVVALTPSPQVTCHPLIGTWRSSDRSLGKSNTDTCGSCKDLTLSACLSSSPSPQCLRWPISKYMTS